VKKLIVPFLAVLIFISESIFVTTLSGEFFNSDKLFIPRFLMIFLVFLAVYCNNRTALYYSVIIGLVFDVVYTEILGVYLFVLPVITYAISKVMNILQNNVFVVSLLAVMAVAFLETVIYGMNYMLGFASMTFQQFLSIRLVPTLLLNTVATIILAYPLRKFLLQHCAEDNNEFLFRKKS